MGLSTFIRYILKPDYCDLFAETLKSIQETSMDDMGATGKGGTNAEATEVI